MKFNVRSNLLSMLAPLLILSTTSACVHGSTPPPAVNSFCAVAKPIFYDSRADSSGTVKQVEEHNRRFVCLCEGDCPNPEK